MLKSNQNVLGYRRVDVWGQGQTLYKPGWWWTVNVFTNYTAVILPTLMKISGTTTNILFVEVIDSRGSRDK